MAATILTYLRRERRKWGFTQAELAHLVGLETGDQISRIEQGHALPTASQLLAFQLIFGMTAHQLFPQLGAKVEDTVLANVTSLVDAIKNEPTLRATRKRALLRQIHSRAVMS